MRSLEAAQHRPGTPVRRRRPDRSGPCAAGRKGVGGGIRRRIDAEEEIAGLHLGAFGVIDGLEDAGHAGPDFHFAHAFDLGRGDGLLGEVGRSDGDDGDGERAGGRRGALLAATDQGQ